MNKTINNCLVKLISYSVRYLTSKQDTRFLGKPEFSLDILKMAVYLELPDGLNILSSNELEAYLLENHVEYSDETHEKVFIVEYCKLDGYRLKNNFYIWSVYHYTYEMQENKDNEKAEFLWASIICPYIYKLNKYKKVTKSNVRQLEKKYPVFDSLKRSNRELIEGVEMKVFFFKTLNNAKGIKDIQPLRGEIDGAVEEAIQGAVIIKTTVNEGKLQK